jgi:peptide deformylase
MAIMDVRKNPDLVLREKASEIDPKEISGARVQSLIADMKVTMHASNGIGIAGPQVGIPERIIIVETGKGPEAFINPQIVSRSLRKTDSEEGCLSIPGVFGIVKRNKAVTVRAFDAHGKEIKIKATGLPAIIFQHEIDHLDGILFIDKVERYTSPPRL